MPRCHHRRCRRRRRPSIKESKRIDKIDHSRIFMAEAADAPAAAVVQPLQVAYCTVSGFPYEYCEFHPDYKKCIAAAAADPALHRYLPIIMNQRAASTKYFIPHMPKSDFNTLLHAPRTRARASLTPLSASGIESLLASLTLDAPASEASAAGGGAASGDASAAGASAKGKKEKEKAVLIFESKKNKGKKATVVRGLDAFGVKLSDASKVNSACLQSLMFMTLHSLPCQPALPPPPPSGIQEEVRKRQHCVLECRQRGGGEPALCSYTLTLLLTRRRWRYRATGSMCGTSWQRLLCTRRMAGAFKRSRCAAFGCKHVARDRVFRFGLPTATSAVSSAKCRHLKVITLCSLDLRET